MKKLDNYLNSLNISLPAESYEKLETYYHMVVEKNKVMNLTAITDEEEFALKHFADSLSVINAFPEFAEKASSGKCSLIDVGTGAGFPGIPLKIAFPELKLTLLDSLQKRVNFLNEVITELRLTGIDAIHSRAEDGASDRALREHFDFAVSRAVAALPVLSEYCIPFVKKGGFFISYKSADIDEELSTSQRAVKLLGGKVRDCRKITLPESDIGRSFVIIEKINSTPKAYPRKAASIKKEPL
jgi:16S rRNA (guanine527-N7)-methyltransferase